MSTRPPQCFSLLDDVLSHLSITTKLQGSSLAAPEWQQLDAVTPKGLLDEAVDVVRKGSVTCYSSPSGRSFFCVKESSVSEANVCIDDCYCNCPGYLQGMLSHPDIFLCKHVLARKLAPLMGCTVEQVLLADDEFALYMNRFLRRSAL